MKKAVRTLAIAASLVAGMTAQTVLASEVEVNDAYPNEVDGRWIYDFSLTNVTSQQVYVTNYYVPYFSDSDISNVVAPKGWTAEVTFASMFDKGESGVLHWYANSVSSGIGAQKTLGGFSYQAGYDGAKAPFIAIYNTGETYAGDPFIPASPLAIAAGFKPLSAVPEPETYAMMLMSLAALGAMKWRPGRDKQA